MGVNRAMFPNPVLYALLALSIATNAIFVSRRVTIDWHRFVHRDQAVPAVTAGDHVRGDPAAVVTIVEYSDFLCPFCARFHDTLKTAVGNDSGIRWVYRHLPISELHPLAGASAEASECAAAQGKFWEYADLLFARQKDVDAEQFPIIARDVGLDQARFTACLQSGSTRARVAADASEFSEGHLTLTPISFVNGTRIEGAVSLPQIRKAIDDARTQSK